ncbi:unnamed protein product, partial [Linum tenue]
SFHFLDPRGNRNRASRGGTGERRGKFFQAQFLSSSGPKIPNFLNSR